MKTTFFTSTIFSFVFAISGCAVGGAGVDSNGNTISEEGSVHGPISRDPNTIVETPNEWTEPTVSPIVDTEFHHNYKTHVTPVIDTTFHSQYNTNQPENNSTKMVVTAITPTLHAENPYVRILVRTVGSHNEPKGSGDMVVARFSGDAIAGAKAPITKCKTDFDSQCMLHWTVPAEAFEKGGSVIVDIASVGQSTKLELPLFATPDPLKISVPGAGFQLPTSPRSEGTSFDIPLYIESASTPGAYDIALNFDNKHVAVSKVTMGSCKAFTNPMHNMSQGANEVGMVKVIGLNAASTADCANADRVHVATVTFTVLKGATGTDTLVASPMDCTINALIDVNFAQLAEGKACDFGDATGTDAEGELLLTAKN
jgi:hypothetical protein